MKIGGFIILAAVLILLVGGVYLLSTRLNAMAVSSGNQQSGSNQQSNSGNQQPNNPSGTFPEGTPLQTHQVSIQDFAFSPSPLTVQVGDTVVWTNMDSAAHTVVSDSGSEIMSGSLGQGQTYSHTFNTPGTYTYHCSVHPNMRGTIIVE